MASLEHPHIVPLYDYWREPDRAYLVLRYLRGGTLRGQPHRRPRPAARRRSARSWPRSARRWPPPTGPAWSTATCKPANVFLDDAGNFYLGDFGIALDGADLADPDRAPCRPARPPTPRPSSCAGSRSARRPTCTGWAITVYEALTGRAAVPRRGHPGRPAAAPAARADPGGAPPPAATCRPRSTRCWPGPRRSRRSTASNGSRTSSRPSSPRSTAALRRPSAPPAGRRRR